MDRENMRVTRAFAGCPAVLFMNSNKSEENIRRIVAQTRAVCQQAGVDLKHEVIVNKGADRDIDRDAVNMLISLLVTGQYDVVVVNELTDLTDDLSDLQEFMGDAGAVGIAFLELSTMCFYLAAPDGRPEGKAVWKVREG